MHIPNGWSFSVGSVDYRGYVGLPAGITATQSANYYFQGSTLQATSRTTFRGPLSKDYLNHDQLLIAAMVWSSCNAVVPLNINAQVRIDNPNPSKQAQITTDSIDGKVKLIQGLQFRRC